MENYGHVGILWLQNFKEIRLQNCKGRIFLHSITAFDSKRNLWNSGFERLSYFGLLCPVPLDRLRQFQHAGDLSLSKQSFPFQRSPSPTLFCTNGAITVRFLWLPRILISVPHYAFCRERLCGGSEQATLRSAHFSFYYFFSSKFLIPNPY